MAVVALLLNSESVEATKLKQKNGYFLEDSSLVQESDRNHNYYKTARADQMLAQESEMVNDIYEPEVTEAETFGDVDNMVSDFTS